MNEQKNGLVVAPEKVRRNEIARYLTGQLAEGKIRSLGVTRGYLVKNAESLGLSNDDLDLVLAARREFTASIPNIFGMIRKWDITTEDCFNLYRVRSSVMDQYEGNGSLSFGTILRFTQIFPSAGLDDEELGEKMLEVFNRINSQLRWVQYINTAIDMVCEAAEYFRASDVDAVLDAMDGNWNLGQDRAATWDDDDLLPNQEN